MGGHAFRQEGLSDSAFPRLPPAVYQALKARLTPLLKKFYEYVETPTEAPEKADHGDLDFSAAVPVMQPEAVHDAEALKLALGATRCIGQNAPGQTTNYAIPVVQGEWSPFGLGDFEGECRGQASEDSSIDTIYYQVDVHVCRDKDEMDRVVFFNSNGDLGMIMGLVASNIGLKLSCKGLFCPNQPLRPVTLSTSFQEICNFMGWAYTRPTFQSNEEAFQWIAQSKFYQERNFRTRDVPGASRVKPERTMYGSFIQWSESRRRSATHVEEKEKEKSSKLQERGRAEALEYFGKKEEQEKSLHDYTLRIQFNNTFNGQKVRQWTSLGDYWRGVKTIMDLVRQEHSVDNLMTLFEREGEMGLKALCLEAKARLGFEKDPVTGLIVQMGNTQI